MQAKPDSQIHIAICDDEPLDRQNTAELTGQLLTAENVNHAISQYASGTDLLAAIKNGARFQLLLLGVMMDTLDGMELAATLWDMGNDTSIVFISSNREMAMQGYEVEAVRYLSKPLEPERLREALRFCLRKSYEKKTLVLPTRRGQRSVSYSHIVSGEAVNRASKLVLPDRTTEEITMKFSQLAVLLPGRQFVLCHRSYFVNLEYVSYLRSREMELSTSAVLPVSKYRAWRSCKRKG